ncbi:S-locus lectin protein kinase family protein isoform 1 [Hibiscus syriacus]|uniref:S-locus lectin protein kinase family protein isoform 1 n=1 Tax=Hibiscus syriacus TaxID=106335 RepID=A0A6A2Y887_HIBSY|nr:S-locus lectin protein kinase family protein isoform 1 [Hibiscus syriacus]
MIKVDVDDELLHKLRLIDTIKRLGVGYHFEREIEKVLHNVYEHHYNYDQTLEATSLRFRLLRESGFNALCGESCTFYFANEIQFYIAYVWVIRVNKTILLLDGTETFNKFKDDEGNFSKSLTSDVKGLLELYEAAHLLVHGEDILEESLAFTTTHMECCQFGVSSFSLSLQCSIPTHPQGPAKNLHKQELFKLSRKHTTPVTSLIGMGDVLSLEIFNWASNNLIIIVACCIHGHLADDIVSHKFEQEIGHCASAVECYMREHGVSEEEACIELKKQADNAWKDINYEKIFGETSKVVPMIVLTRVLNLTRACESGIRLEMGIHTFMPPAPAIPAAFATTQGQVAVNKLVPLIGYPGVAMWQFVPPASRDTSQDHVLLSPVA